MRIVAMCLLLLVASAVGAADRLAMVRDLMQAQGLLQMFEDQLTLGKKQAREQATQMTEQMLSGLNPTAEVRERLRKASEDFTTAMEVPWTAKDIVDQWAKTYAIEFTDAELEHLLAYYQSPLGKKDVVVSQRALPVVSAHFVERYAPIQHAATQKYISDLNRIVKECKCRK